MAADPTEAASGGAVPDAAAPAATSAWKWLVPTLSTVLGSIVIVGGLAAIATPKFGANRPRANLRACLANQKTIAGAVEMYQLDSGESVEDLTKVAGALVSGGYLMQYPRDPGQGKGSEDHYRLRRPEEACPRHPEAPEKECEECQVHGVGTVMCEVHGSLFDFRSAPGDR